MTADTSKPPQPYRLWVAVPADGGEVAVDIGEAATRAEADVALAALAGPWLEATLRRPDRTHDEGARPRWRRLPASKWRRVRHWTAAEQERFASDDVDRIAAWLRRAGVRLTWERALRSPWPGHERGPLTEATSLAPDETLRSMRRRGHDALRAVIGEVYTEGMERGGALARERSMEQHWRRFAEIADRDIADLRRELREARNEARRLRGEPEVTEEQEREAARARVSANAAEILRMLGGDEVDSLPSRGGEA